MNVSAGILQRCTLTLLLPVPSQVWLETLLPSPRGQLCCGSEVSLYLLRARFWFIGLFPEVCPANALPGCGNGAWR